MIVSGQIIWMYPISTLSAPSGVTRMAGAKAYAAKLAASPMATAHIQDSVSIYSLEGVPWSLKRTRSNPTPPDWTFQVRETLAFETMSLGGVHQSLCSKCKYLLRSQQVFVIRRLNRKRTFFVITKLVPVRELLAYPAEETSLVKVKVAHTNTNCRKDGENQADVP